LQKKVQKLTQQLAEKEAENKTKEKSGEKESESIKLHLEARLKETLEEAKRHYESYMTMRDQYNQFVEGRINQMVEKCMSKDQKEVINSVKQNKLKSDVIQ
jgi:hypothetical protein